MQNTSTIVILAALISLGLTFGDEKSKSPASSKVTTSGKVNPSKKPTLKAKSKPKLKSSAGPMQVDEPSTKIALRLEPKASKEQRALARGLTAEQKLAFRERKEKIQTMINLITAKRQALQAAKPEERASLARELHIMILEKDPGSASLPVHARVTAGGKQVIVAPAISPEVEAASPSQEQLFQLQQQKWRDQQFSPN